MKIRVRRKMSATWIIYILLFYFFIFRDVLEQYFIPFKIADEMLAAASILVFICRTIHSGNDMKTSWKSIPLWLTVFCIAGLAGNALWSYQPFWEAALPDLFLNIKFWLLLFTGAAVYSNLDMKKYASPMMFHISVVTWLYTILIVVDYAVHIFSVEVRYGLRSTTLFYTHPTVVAGISVYIIGLLFTLHEYIGQKTIGYFFWWNGILCSTLRSKAIGAAMLFVLTYYFIFIRKKKIQFRTMLLLVPPIILIGWDQIYFYFFSSIQQGSARYQLLVKSFLIAFDHFPFGSGFGTFGSHFSAVIYSPVYGKYGINNIYGLEQGRASFVSDSFWPMILGETGVVGLIAFVMVIFCLFCKIQKLYQFNKNFYMSAVAMLMYVLISSTAESAFAHPLMCPMAMWIGFLLEQYPKRSIKHVNQLICHETWIRKKENTNENSVS